MKLTIFQTFTLQLYHKIAQTLEIYFKEGVKTIVEDKNTLILGIIIHTINKNANFKILQF
jgi:hypothetical protein